MGAPLGGDQPVAYGFIGSGGVNSEVVSNQPDPVVRLSTVYGFCKVFRMRRDDGYDYFGGAA
jgi:hypothetical protein